METEKTIDEKRFTLTWKVAVSIMAFLLIVSNTFTLQIERISENAENQIELESATRRRVANAIQELNYKTEIKDLKKDLADCKNK